ncbi:MAG TPA: phytase [Herpetosiphonaceae bacterium]
MLNQRSRLDLRRPHRSTPLILITMLLFIGIGTLSAHPQPQATAAVGSIVPTVETQPMPHTGDSADDPAIWIHPTNTAESTIIGTDKQGGLAVYSLAGQELQYRADGNMNNVDLRYNFPLDGGSVALATATNRTNNSIAIYRVDPATRLLEPIAARTITPGMTAYGTCMYHSPLSGKYYVFLTSSTGTVEQWELFDNGAGKVDARRVRSFSLGSSSEGCVADDELARLYISEEDVGIWRYGAEPGDDPAARVLVDSTSSETGLSADVEGLTLYYTSARTGYLIVSGQGTHSYLVYRREADNAYLDTFVISAGNGIDAVQSTDGIDVSNVNLGPRFPQGVFVAQDGSNMVNSQNFQNFKLVPWQTIANAFSPSLTIDTAWDPRRVGAPDPSPSPSPSPSPPPNTRTFTAEADTRVEQANPNANYGTAPQLRTDGSSTTAVQSYLRFTVAGIIHPITSAKLRIYATTSTINGPSVHTSANAWSETGITWNTRISYSSSALDDRGAVSANTWVDYNVAPVVSSNGTYSFVLASNSSDGLTLSSREGSAPPQLVVTLGSTPLYRTFVPWARGEP